MPFKNFRVLSHKPLLRVSKASLPRLIALSVLPLFGMVAAFGIAPDTTPHHVPVQTVIEAIELPQAGDEDSAELDQYTYLEKVQRGDTVARLLSRLNVDDPSALAFLRNDSIAMGFLRLRPGSTVQASVNEEGELLSLRYINGPSAVLLVERTEAGFRASEQPVAQAPRVEFKSGKVASSLFAATDEAGIPDAVAQQLASIFSTDIDFHQDLQKGDRFTVVYEVFYEAGEPVRAGRVLAAEFVNQGRAYRAVYYQHSDGNGAYYTPEGKSLRKAFLRSPLEFSRISSGFTSARLHPVHNTWRAHKGVDLAAPTGTRVLATADGIVEFAGRQNGYGNVIILRHSDRYSTLYGHLSGFAPGLVKGERVRQGDMIGYVGMTGVATGPHLHYEFMVAGVHQDPMRIALPNVLPLLPEHRKAFNESARVLTAKLDVLRTTPQVTMFE